MLTVTKKKTEQTFKKESVSEKERVKIKLLTSILARVLTV